ncbi:MULTISPECIES: ABC transporter substrate-binding protein [Halorussus]|uniref:ABC transporter substrate-binding protein n=1 Tax=Halorussus TaxID=1070314 RepID=UPI00209F119B|nr:ABC transporter substrate-binding protein [Halorussus vallis]USZ75554.1 ABC transporter substrate-binding protein [Halorussus vallis]
MPSGNNRVDTTTQDRPGMKRRRWLQAVGLGGIAGLAGCQGTDTPQDSTTTESTTTGDVGFGTETGTDTQTTSEMKELPKVGGTYTDAISSDITTLNPLYNTESTAGTLIMQALDSAYYFEPGQKLFPYWMDLTTDDGRVWTAKLKENLQWSEPYGQMTAEDWVYMIKEIHQTEWSGTAASTDWYRNDEPIPVEKTGKYTFDIKLPEVDPMFHKKPTMWGAQCVPKKLVKPYVDKQDVDGLKKDKKLLNLSFNGNLGPYNLDTWERSKKVVFTRNDSYYMREDTDMPKLYQKAPYFDKRVTQVIQESSSRLGALKTGQIDVAQVPPNKASQFKSRDDTYLNVTPQPYIVKIAYNMRANGWKPFRKQKVRQALGCAVDKKKLVRGVYRGYANPAYTYQPRWSQWYDSEQVVQYGTGDLYGSEVTRKRMKEALKGTDYGYNGKKLVDGNGEQVELTLYHSAGQSDEKATAEFVAQEFQQNAGIKVTVNGMPGAQFDKKYVQQSAPDKPKWNISSYNAGPRDQATSQKPWDMSLVYGLNTYPMTPSSAETFFLKKGGFNYYGYYPSYDFKSLFSKASKTVDKAKRKQIYGEIFGKLSKDQPMGMLVMNSDIYGYRNGIVGPVEEFFSGYDEMIWYKEDGQ